MCMYAVLVILASSVVTTVAQDDLIVRTVYGDVEGHFVTLANGQVVRSFLGIPFAAPPVAGLRFRAPEEPQPWGDTFVADRLGNACPQHNTLIPVSHPDWDRFDEDCLNLNIITPYNHTEAGPYAVHVFVHGGAYSAGANIQYLGHFHAARGVIFVALNYRLGQLGFLYTGDDVARGNYGLLDQILALQFVQQNIANFGGDLNRITLSGVSAGGSSVGQLILSPLATGLFQQAIMFSGTELSPWSYNRPDVSVNFTRQLAEDTDCLSEDSLQMVDCLRGLSSQDIMNATWVPYPAQASMGFVPVPDLLGGVLPDYPENLRESGQFARVPLMAGVTNKESAGSYEQEGYNSTEFHEEVEILLEDRFLLYGPRTVEDVIKAAKFQYTPWPNIENRTANRDNIVQMRDDVSFGVPAETSLRYHAAHNTTYQYVFSYRSVVMDDISQNWTGATHATDMPYVVGFPLLNDNPEVADDFETVSLLDWTEMDKDYSNYWMNLITNFVKFGNPTPTPVPAPGGKPPTTWPPYRLDAMNYLEVHNDSISVKQNLMQRNNALWREYVPWVVEYTASTAGTSVHMVDEYPMVTKEDDRDLRRFITMY